MKLLRRALSALALMGVIAGALRVRGSGGTPPQHGGWRPLELPDDGAPSPAGGGDPAPA